MLGIRHPKRGKQIKMKPIKKGPYPTATEGAASAALHVKSPQTESWSYQLAFQDNELLLKDELRPVRLHLEFLKPEMIQLEYQIDATIVIFGSARTKDAESARGVSMVSIFATILSHV